MKPLRLEWNIFRKALRVLKGNRVLLHLQIDDAGSFSADIADTVAMEVSRFTVLSSSSIDNGINLYICQNDRKDNPINRIRVTNQDIPLRMMDDLKALHRGQDEVEVRYIDLGENPAALEHFPVRVTPTILFFLPEGKPFMPPEDFPISMILYSSRDTGEHVFTVHEGYLPRTDLDKLVETLRDA